MGARRMTAAHSDGGAGLKGRPARLEWTRDHVALAEDPDTFVP